MAGLKTYATIQDLVDSNDLLASKGFEYTKSSVVDSSKDVSNAELKINVLEYINDSSYDDNDIFFYDMLGHVRFIDVGEERVAWTTPDTLIYLNTPGPVGKNVRHWDFIYDHECLHQLWDTFGVADKIRESGQKYDHQVLNIASDCVINDYLAHYRKKLMPDNLITPQYLKDNFGITYDRKKDTQYTLYLKLLEVAEKLKQELKNMLDDMMDDESGDGSGGSGSGEGNESGDNKSKGSNGSGSGDSSDKDKDGGTGNGEGNGDNSQEGDGKEDDKESGSGGKDSDKSGDGQGKDSKSGGKNDKDGQGKDSKSGGKNDKDGQGKDSKSGGKNGGKSNGSGDDNESGDSKQAGRGHVEIRETPEDLAKIREHGKKIIEKASKRIADVFGNFVKQCQRSVEMKKEGLAISSAHAAPSWNLKMNARIIAYVKQRVFEKKRQFKKSYKKQNRRAGFSKAGAPIMPGKKIIDNKLTVNAAFYIDRSGSMGSALDNVFKAAYTICEALKKTFSSEKVVDEVTFKIYTFDDVIKEIKFGSKTNVGGGTCPFHNILKHIADNGTEFLFNIIMTDAEFEVNSTEVTKLLKDIDGIMMFITNTPNMDVKDIADKNKLKLEYIEADSQFTV